VTAGTVAGRPGDTSRPATDLDTRPWRSMVLPVDTAGHLIVPSGPAKPRPKRATRPKGLAGLDLVAWAESEDELEAWVLAAVGNHKHPTVLTGRLWVHHSRNPRQDTPGLPDLFLVGHHGAMHVELKREGESLTVEQLFVLAQLDRLGRDVAAWYPRHRHHGVISRELHRLAYGRTAA
jgi:hypothetical protein